MNKQNWRPVLAVALVLGLVLIAGIAFGKIQGKTNEKKPQAVSAVEPSAEEKKPEAIEKQTETESETEEKQTETTETETEQETSEPEAPKENGVFIEDAKTVWTTADVNFRALDSLESDVIKVLKNRTKVEQIAASDDWVKVTYEDVTGYVSKKYVTDEEPKEPETPQEQPAAQIDAQNLAPSNRQHGVIVIDAGHQRSGDSTKEPNGPGSSTMKARVTGGARGVATGVYEYQLNLDIALKLQEELQNRGYTVYMTRTSHDVNISNMERAQYATSVNADICIRIHANGSDDSGTTGAMTLAPSSSNPYISSLAGESQRLSQCIVDSYCNATGIRNRGVVTSDTMTGINWCTMPVTILEMGFMSNANEDINMEDANFQQQMVQGIANGVDSYYQ